MSEARRIPVEQGTDLPSLTVLVDGQAISAEFNVVGITIQKAVNRIASAVLTVADGDAAAQDFPVSNADDFVPGKEVEITAGYHREEETVFKGVVTGHGIKVRGNKPALLVVQMRDAADKLTAVRKSGYFVDQTDSDIIEGLLGEHGLEAEVTATSLSHADMVRHDASDWDFITSRAEVNGMLVLVDDGKVTVAPPELGSSELELVYGATLMEFEAEVDARRQLNEVTSVAWDAAGQAMLEESGDDPGLDGPGNLAPSDLAGLFDQPAVLRHTGALVGEELKAWADARLLRSRLAKVVGRAACQGFPAIKPGATITLSGVGDRFNGDVYVAGVQHDISLKNWTTTFQFGLGDEWFSHRYDVTDAPAGGLVPSVHGLQIATVTQIGEDPDGEHRIKVVMPVVDPAEEGIWARVASLDAGDTRGAFFRPEIGDEVVLGFLNADPRDAVVLGMLNSSAKPAPIEASDDNHEKGFVTRSGMRLHFNDDTVVVTADTPNGNVLRLSEEDGGITIEDENGNSMVMSSDGINIDSAGDVNITASGDVNIEGTNVGLTASGEFKAEGSGGAEVSSSANAILKGSMVQIN